MAPSDLSCMYAPALHISRPLPIHPFLCGVLTRERESLTDNGNRTLHQLREILNEHR
jgi:hypothetical protein